VCLLLPGQGTVEDSMHKLTHRQSLVALIVHKLRTAE
jgi:imidazoleglycerol phosphate synthase glutamine amidotransferase subunit HisH